MPINRPAPGRFTLKMSAAIALSIVLMTNSITAGLTKDQATKTSDKKPSPGFEFLSLGVGSIELPLFIGDGSVTPIVENNAEIGKTFIPGTGGVSLFSVYYLTTKQKPLDFLRSRLLDAHSYSIKNSMDKPVESTISGDIWDKLNKPQIFYGKCKKAGQELHCFEITYDPSFKDELSPGNLAYR